MNLSLPTLRTLSLEAPRGVGSASEETAHVRRLWSLVTLLGLYATALLVVLLVSDGPDVGCILMGIAGHVLYASAKMAQAWREATWMEDARFRLYRRFRRA